MVYVIYITGTCTRVLPIVVWTRRLIRVSTFCKLFNYSSLGISQSHSLTYLKSKLESSKTYCGGVHSVYFWLRSIAVIILFPLLTTCSCCNKTNKLRNNITSQERRYNVAATSRRCSDVVATLYEPQDVARGSSSFKNRKKYNIKHKFAINCTNKF